MMKKTFWLVLLATVLTASFSMAAGLKVGDKAPDFKLEDALTGTVYSLSSPEFAGKVLYIVYASTSAADDNDHVSDALQDNKDIQRLKSEKKYSGLGIANQKDSGVPNFLIKSIAKSKQKKTRAIILLDPDFTIGKIWGVPHKIATSILLDEDHVVRYIYSGKTPAENIPKIIELIKEYVAK
jgi:predicted transcriptional regulator